MLTLDPYDLVVEEGDKRANFIYLGGFGRPDKKKSKITEYLDKHSHFEALVRLCDSNSKYLALVYVSSAPYAPMPKIRRVYCDEDATTLDPILKEATELWRKRIGEFVASGQNPGTCVLGAGVSAYTLLKGKRKPEKVNIIRVPAIIQGSLSWEASIDEILKHLRSKHVDCEYNQGSMD